MPKGVYERSAAEHKRIASLVYLLDHTSESYRRKQSLAHLGTKHTNEAIDKIRESNRRRTVSAKTREKMSQSRKQWHSTHPGWQPHVMIKSVSRSATSTLDTLETLFGRKFEREYEMCG